MKIWSNDLQCFRAYQGAEAGLLDEMDRPYNWSEPGEELDDMEPIYSSQVHIERPLSAAEWEALEKIEPRYDWDGDFPDDMNDWNPEEHRMWINFDYFSLAARRYLESLPD